jgi:hypothetical protein
LDVWNPFSFAFLTISDKNTIFIFFFKMATGGHFGCQKLMFDKSATFIFQIHFQKPFSSAKVMPIFFAPYKVGSTLALLNGFW